MALYQMYYVLFLIIGINYTNQKTETGAEQVEEYLSLLKDKKVGIVANHTSLIKDQNLVDSLVKLNVKVVKIFTPEHGFQGKLGAGEIVNDTLYSKSGIPVISLYKSNKKPSPKVLKGIDMVIFDLQDVGVRFFTYISTLHYMMEVCAENGLPLIVFDRPNPNGFYIDGPLLTPRFRSFIGLHPVPIVHGMTLGEYALMINGEGWLKNKIKCSLMVIRCKNYSHKSLYNLPINPSPNLPNMQSVYLYPSIGLFEGTVFSVGRGTDYPFLVYGHSAFTKGDFKFKPKSVLASPTPPQLGEECYGVDLRSYPVKNIIATKKINLEWLISAYNGFQKKDSFFIPYFNLLCGNNILEKQIRNGMPEDVIRKSWEEGLTSFKEIRKKYLLYPDFE